MSQNKTILSFVHQNSTNLVSPPSLPAGFFSQLFKLHEARELTAELRKTSPVSVLLSSRFPLNQCSHPPLLDSKHSVRDSVRCAVEDLSCIEALYINANRYGLPPIPGLQRWGTAELRMSPQIAHVDPEKREVSPVKRADAATPSILVKSSALDAEQLVTLIKETFPLCLQKKFGLLDSAAKDTVVVDALNYAVNLFFLGFKSSSTRELCEEIMRTKALGELKGALMSFEQAFIDKYDELAFERFEDVVFEGATGQLLWEHMPGVDNPGSYRLFKAAFMMEPGNILDFSLEEYLSDTYRIERRPYTSFTPQQEVLNAYGKVAIRMNLIRFFYTARSEYYVLMRAKRSPLPVDMYQMPEVGMLQSTIEKFLSTVEERGAPRIKTKTLRFADVPS